MAPYRRMHNAVYAEVLIPIAMNEAKYLKIVQP